MKKHYETHVEDTDKLISVAGPVLDYKSWYEQYRKLMEEQAQRKYGLYTPTSEGGGDFDPSSFDQAWTVVGKTNEDTDRATITNITGNGNDLILSNFGFAEGSGYNEEGEYAGYLVTDGVDDKVRSAAFTMNEDWTIVGDWELLSNVQINCGIVKAQNVYLYNTANGLLITINNPRSLQSFGTKSLRAICSDGRLYDRNWVEYEYTADQNFAIVESSLNIGFNLNNYTQIAFKNLGIYNDQILSKDDCIKAYNYLQTLKSK